MRRPGASTPPITRPWRNGPAVLRGPEPAEHPDPTPEGRRIRQAFIAPPGYVLMAADYSQIELRIMAHLSGDEGLLAAFAEDRDVHQATAAEVFGMPLDTVTRTSAATAKAINFGLIYGMSPVRPRAAARHRSRRRRSRYVERYFARYPGVKRYMDETRTQRAGDRATSRPCSAGACTCLTSAQATRQQRQYAERSAINAPMQGTAADIIKRAMIAVDAWCQRERRTRASHHAGARRTGARGPRGRCRQRRQGNPRADDNAPANCASRSGSTSEWDRTGIKHTRSCCQKRRTSRNRNSDLLVVST